MSLLIEYPKYIVFKIYFKIWGISLNKPQRMALQKMCSDQMGLSCISIISKLLEKSQIVSNLVNILNWKKMKIQHIVT